MASVRLSGVTKSFGGADILRDIDLAIADGEFVVFVGPSGCGKSTLLRLIAGLEEVSRGQILIGERDVTLAAPAARGVSMVFQSYALYPHMTVRRNISFGLRLARHAEETVEERVAEAARMLQIGELMDRYPRQLSGGQRQRVAIARAIVRHPEVFLFDEPLSNLDAALRARTRLEIARMHETLAKTMIYVTHDQLEAMTLADRIVLLNGGGIEQVGPPAELYHRPATRFAAAFMGSPTMNLLPVAIAGGSARLASGDRVPVPGFAAMEEATLGIRPEHLRLAEAGMPGTLPARVALVEELGEARIVHAALRDGTMLALRATEAVTLAKGAEVRLAVDPDRLHLFGRDGSRMEPQ